MFTGPVETKVQTTSVLTLVGSVGLAVLNAVAAHSELLGGLPALAQFVILAAIPPAVTFLTGYVSPSTPRPDLYEYSGPAQPWLPAPPAPVASANQVPIPPPFDEPYGPHNFGDPGATQAFGPGRHRA